MGDNGAHAPADRIQECRRSGGVRQRRDTRYRYQSIRGLRAHPRKRSRARLDRAGKLRARGCFRRSGSALAEHGRCEHGCCAGKRASVRRDAAAAEGNRAARRRAGGHQQHPAGCFRRAGLSGHHQPRRRQTARGVEYRRDRDPLVRRRTQGRPLSLRIRTRRTTIHTLCSAQTKQLGDAHLES